MSDIDTLRAQVEAARIRFREAATTPDIPATDYNAAKAAFDGALKAYHAALGYA